VLENHATHICTSTDAEFTEYEKDVLLKLPHKEYILYFFNDIELLCALLKYMLVSQCVVIWGLLPW